MKQKRKYSHEHDVKPQRGDWIMAGGLLVELIEPAEPVRTTYGDKQQKWVGVTVDGSLIEVELLQYRESPHWESFFLAGKYAAADDAQCALLFGDLA